MSQLQPARPRVRPASTAADERVCAPAHLPSTVAPACSRRAAAADTRPRRRGRRHAEKRAGAGAHLR